MPFTSDRDCQLQVYRDRLFCFYFHDSTRVFFLTKTFAGHWSTAQDVGIDSWSGTPTAFMFKGQLYVLGSGESSGEGIQSKLATFNPSTQAFEQRDFDFFFHGTPALVEYRASLYMFYRLVEGGALFWAHTQNMREWRTDGPVYQDGVTTVTPRQDAVACVYQGLIHLLHGTGQGLSLLKYDGLGWGRSVPFISRVYESAPGLVVHDGLLTVVGSRPADDRLDANLYLHRYDGNAQGIVEASIGLVALGSPAVAVLDGELQVIYPSA